MKIEQPADLNKHVAPTVPLTWAVRWQALSPLLPLLILSSILLVEQVDFRLWLNDRSLVSELPLLLVCALLPTVGSLALFEVLAKIEHRTKRSITLEPNRVLISPANYSRLAWKQINAWRLEPLSAGPSGLSKLTLEYARDKKGRLRREWSMVLRQPDQVHLLLAELEHFRQVGLNTAQVIQLSEPSLPKPPRRILPGLIASALGFWCLIHGMPLLGVGLKSPDGHHDESTSTSSLTSRETAKIQQFVARHFASHSQVRTFLLVTGGGITALGVGLYLWGFYLARRSDGVKRSQARNSQDFTGSAGGA